MLQGKVGYSKKLVTPCGLCLYPSPLPCMSMKIPNTKGSRNIRKSAKIVTMSLEGGGEGGYPLSLAFGGRGRGFGSDNFLSLAFGGKFSHKLDNFWPNLS